MSKKMISFEISDSVREQLRIEAFKRKISVSALIRLILAEFFVANKNKTGYQAPDDGGGGMYKNY